MSKIAGEKCHLTNKLEFYFCLLILKIFKSIHLVIQKSYFSIHFWRVLPYNYDKFGIFTFSLKSFRSKRERKVENETKRGFEAFKKIIACIFTNVLNFTYFSEEAKGEGNLSLHQSKK